MAEKYRMCGHKRPPYSYAELICMALKENKNKLTLSMINSWIKENFLYYQLADPRWQNSIRQNLSYNKCFVKVPPINGQSGKGGFWKFDAENVKLGNTKRSRKRGIKSNKDVSCSKQIGSKKQEMIIKATTMKSPSPQQAEDIFLRFDHIPKVIVEPMPQLCWEDTPATERRESGDSFTSFFIDSE